MSQDALEKVIFQLKRRIEEVDGELRALPAPELEPEVEEAIRESVDNAGRENARDYNQTLAGVREIMDDEFD